MKRKIRSPLADPTWALYPRGRAPKVVSYIFLRSQCPEGEIFQIGAAKDSLPIALELCASVINIAIVLS